MKKIIALVLIVLIIVFYVSKENKVTSKNGIKHNEIAKNIIPNIPKSLKISNQAPEQKVYEVADEKFNIFEKYNTEWESSVSKIFTKEEFQTYQSLKEENEKEKLKAYQDYHDYLRKEQGENFKYNISEDQSIMEKKVNDLYLEKLLKVIGESKFKIYSKQKLDFNEKMRRDLKGQNVLIIEY